MPNDATARVLFAGVASVQAQKVVSQLVGDDEAQGFEGGDLKVELLEKIEELSSRLAMRHYDCVLLPMGDDSIAVEQTVAQLQSAAPLLPVVVLGESDHPQAAVGVMREGASDYLSVRHLDARTLRQSISGAVRRGFYKQQVRAAQEAALVAERVRKERQLQIRGFFDFAAVAMALLGPQGDILRANPALKSLCGYELSELTQLNLEKLIATEYRATVCEMLSFLRGGGCQNQDEEVQLLDKSGEVIWISLSLAVISDEDGKVQGYALHATDIRSRKATEAELRRSERRFEELLAQAPVGIFETNVGGACRYVNDKWCSLSGLTYTQAIGPGWMASVHTEDRTDVMRRWSEACGSQREFSMEFRFARPDESVVWVAGRAAPIFEADGTLIGYLGTVADVTDRHTAEVSLQRTSTLLRNILDSAPLSVIATNENGEITQVNRGACSLLGYESADLIGRPVSDTLDVGVEANSEGEGSTDLWLDSAANSSCEWLYRCKDGHTVPVDLSVSEMKDAAGETFGYVNVAVDITERLRRNRELVEAKERAEHASIAKAEFLAKMSHEIRTPMNSVLGMTELLLGTPLSSDQRRYLEVSQQSGKALLHLINDILDFSRVEARRLTLETIPFDLNEVLVTCLRGPSHAANQKGVPLILRVEPDSPRRVIGDPHRLGQIVVNLVSNAVKFTDSGEIIVDVAFANDAAEEKTTLYLAVQDSGPGVAPEEQQRIFRAFVQEENGIARRFGGTGLGLSICSQLVELMDGEIWLQSELGKGSTFHVTVALRVDPIAHEYPVSSGLRIDMGVALVVDPHRVRREVHCSILRRLGYYPIDAPNLSEAVDAIRVLCAAGGTLGVAVVDVPEWEERGGAFIERLGLLTGPVPTVCLSDAPGLDPTPGMEAVVYQLKPFTPEQLRHAIAQADAPISERMRASLIPMPLDEPTQRALRILVAEDNATNQLVVSSMLDRLGHHVDIVENGQEALNRCAARSYDLVLMDLQMPVMGGLEAARAIRDRERGTSHHLPVVALTAQAMADDRLACQEAGMDDYLSKPLEMAALSGVLKKYCDEAAPAMPASGPPSTMKNKVHQDTCVNFSLFRERIGENGEAILKLCSLFERDTSRHLVELREQIQSRSSPEKSAAAHTIKGMLRNICANQAADLAARLEKSTGRGAWDQAEQELGDLESLVDRVALELRLCAEQSLTARET